jgi:cbb3-type cytochrome oxidase maturation protein
MVFFSWIFLVVLSLAVSLCAFLWAVRSGQFSDQGRARFLPLNDSLRTSGPENPAGRPAEIYALLGIAGIALTGIISAILLSLWRTQG